MSADTVARAEVSSSQVSARGSGSCSPVAKGRARSTSLPRASLNADVGCFPVIVDDLILEYRFVQPDLGTLVAAFLLPGFRQPLLGGVVSAFHCSFSRHRPGGRAKPFRPHGLAARICVNERWPQYRTCVKPRLATAA